MDEREIGEESGPRAARDAPNARPGEVIDLGTFATELHAGQVVRLIRTHDLEFLRMVLPSGRTVPTHEFSREIVVHCLEGRVRLVSSAQTCDLKAGQLVLYASEEPFTVLGLENAVLLIVSALSKTGQNVEMIG